MTTDVGSKKRESFPILNRDKNLFSSPLRGGTTDPPAQWLPGGFSTRGKTTGA